MAGRIPVFDANYGTEMARIRAQRAENAADRAAQSDENQKAFWRNFGANLLGKAIDIGGDIGVSKYKDSLTQDREEIDRGAYAPDESDWIPNEAQARIREMAQARAADETRSMVQYQDAPETSRRRLSIDTGVAAPVVAAAPVSNEPKPLSPKVAERINTLGILPAEPPVEAMSVAAPVQPVAPARPVYEPSAKPESFSDMGGQPLATFKERNQFIRKVGVESDKANRHLDPKTQAKLDASRAKLDNLNADTAYRLAQADPSKLQAELGSLNAQQQAALKLAEMRQQKLDEANRVARAKLTVGSPEYEVVRQKSVETAVKIAQSTEVRESGSGSSSFGTSGGGKFSKSQGGSSGTNLPRVGAIAVADDMGFGRAIIPDGQKRYVLRGEGGLVTVYVPEYDQETSAYWGREIGRSEDGGKTWIKSPPPSEDDGSPSKRARARGRRRVGGGGGGNNPAPPTDKGTLGAVVDALGAPFRAVADAVDGSTAPAPAPAPAEKTIRDMTDAELQKYQADLNKSGVEFAIKQAPSWAKDIVRDGANAESVAAEIKRRDDERKAGERAAEKATGSTKTFADKARALANALDDDKYKPIGNVRLAQVMAEKGYTGNDIVTIPGHDAKLAKSDFDAALAGGNISARIQKKADDGDELAKKKVAAFKAVKDDAVRLKAAENSAAAARKRAALEAGLQTLQIEYRASGQPKEKMWEQLQTFGLPIDDADLKTKYAPGPGAQDRLPQPRPGDQSKSRVLDEADKLFAQLDALPWSADRKRRVYLSEIKKRGLV